MHCDRCEHDDAEAVGVELKYWLAEAMTGVLGPEVRIQGTPQFSSQFGGGTFSADIMLGHLRTRTGGLDSAAISEVLSWTVGGKHSIVVTHGSICVGEWLIWRSDPVDGDGPVTVSGFEFDGYPQFRSLNDDYIGTWGQLNIASRLLRDAFYSYQPLAITVPWLDSTTTRRVERSSHTAYYGDVLDEISSPANGFQWRVVPTLRWENGRPARVVREVEFGETEIRRTSSTRLAMAGEGGRQGNLAAFPRPAQDFSKYAQSVYGWGSGQGAKQKWVGLSDPTLTNAGHLIVTKNVTFSGVSNTSILTSLTRAALTEAQELREPVTATVLADKVPTVPQVGDVLPVSVGVSAAWPHGYTGSMQVGRVDMRPSGNHLNTFELLAL